MFTSAILQCTVTGQKFLHWNIDDIASNLDVNCHQFGALRFEIFFKVIVNRYKGKTSSRLDVALVVYYWSLHIF
jgi:hypothetical protein